MPTVLEYKYNKTFVLKLLTVGGMHANSDTKRKKDRLLGELKGGGYCLGQQGQ